MGLIQNDDQIKAAVEARRKALAAQAAAAVPNNDPPEPGDQAATPTDASKQAWDNGLDLFGTPHRGAAELEAVKVGLIKRHISWPYTLDMSAAQFAQAILPKRLIDRGGVDPETYAYLILTGAEWTEDERDVAVSASGAYIVQTHDQILWNDWYSKGSFAKAFRARLDEEKAKAGTPDGHAGVASDDSPSPSGGDGGRKG